MDMALHNRWMSEIRALVLKSLEPYDAAVYLYGSRARGDWKRLSDVDIAIDPHAALPPETLSDLQESLEECPVPLQVEIADLSKASPEFRKRVLEEAVLWRA